MSEHITIPENITELKEVIKYLCKKCDVNYRAMCFHFNIFESGIYYRIYQNEIKTNEINTTEFCEFALKNEPEYNEIKYQKAKNICIKQYKSWKKAFKL